MSERCQYIGLYVPTLGRRNCFHSARFFFPMDPMDSGWNILPFLGVYIRIEMSVFYSCVLFNLLGVNSSRLGPRFFLASDLTCPNFCHEGKKAEKAEKTEKASKVDMTAAGSCKAKVGNFMALCLEGVFSIFHGSLYGLTKSKVLSCF